jgi:hypothetical protein
MVDLCLDKDVSVIDIRRLGWGFGGNGWRWRKRLFAWVLLPDSDTSYSV